MRRALVVLHRWFGLFIAGFLLVSGLTGAIISWDHELDEWLNPHLYQAQWNDTAPDSTLAIANRLEAADARLTVTYLPLAVEPGRALMMSVEPRGAVAADANSLRFNQVAVNPTTEEIQGRRMWGEASLSRENLLPFLYKLHYSMHIPDGFGLELGVLFIGIVGIVWLIDCLVALIISFPSPRAWRKSLTLRWRQGGIRLLFDVHRSGAMWIWLLLGTLALTSVSMNLGPEVMRPLVNLLSPLSSSPFDARPAVAGVTPSASREAIIERALHDAPAHSIAAPAGAVFYSPQFNTYGVGFFEPGADHGDGGLGNPWLYYDGTTGAPAGVDIPGTGSAGDIFMQAQFPLHSGRIIGIPGRILVSILGLAVATLSITGIVIWARRRAARRLETASESSRLPAVTA